MSPYYEKKTGEKFVSTAKFPNREENREELTERFNGRLIESGSPHTMFFSKKGTLLAQGHIRVVYGDHGPYIEFLPEQMVRPSWKAIRVGIGWFDECQPSDGSYCKLYVQTKEVTMLKKPPMGVNSCYNNRYESNEGYADYRKGRLYINPFELGRIDIIYPNVDNQIQSLRDINMRLRNGR